MEKLRNAVKSEGYKAENIQYGRDSSLLYSYTKLHISCIMKVISVKLAMEQRLC